MTNEQWISLHKELADLLIKRCQEYGLPENTWMIWFSFDDVLSSVNYGEWHPYSDSALEALDKDRKTILFSA